MDRFWSKVDKRGDDECWDWLAYRDKRGYGHFGYGNGSIGAHRFSYILTNGSIPDGLNICHKCDRPCCVNPAHLFAGTTLDNVRDMMAKGRYTPHGQKGEKNGGGGKLKESHVEYIRLLIAAGYTYDEIAYWYRVDRSLIGYIKQGKKWSHHPQVWKPNRWPESLTA